MNTRAPMYIALGLTIPWILSYTVTQTAIFTAIAILPLLGFVHEMLHLIAIKIRRIEHEFVIDKLMLGFRVKINEHSDYLFLALFPQILTVLLIALAFVGNEVALVLAILHLAVSIEDFIRSFKHLYGLLTAR